MIFISWRFSFLRKHNLCKQIWHGLKDWCSCFVNKPENIYRVLCFEISHIRSSIGKKLLCFHEWDFWKSFRNSNAFPALMVYPQMNFLCQVSWWISLFFRLKSFSSKSPLNIQKVQFKEKARKTWNMTHLNSLKKYFCHQLAVFTWFDDNLP